MSRARFEFAFALAAIIALLHDVILTIGAFALFGRELSLIIVGAVANDRWLFDQRYDRSL